MGLALDEPETNEKPVPVNGLDVLISEEIKAIAERTVVDYIKSPMGEMFDIDTGLSGC